MTKKNQQSKQLKLTNQFLVASPILNETAFERSVILVCEHTQDGAMGIVINRPTEAKLSEIFLQLKIDFLPNGPGKQTLLSGGPVGPENGFVLHGQDGGAWKNSLKVSPSLSLTSSRDILEALAINKGPKHNLITLGYAGWEGQQLEDELMENAWLIAPVNDSILFQAPMRERWELALKSIGISNLYQLSHFHGHA